MKKTKTSKFIRTKIAMARALEISRPTLDHYLSLPKSPVRTAQGYDLEAITGWISDHTESEKTSAKTNETIKGLKAKEIGLRCARMKFRLEQERGIYAKKTEFAAAVGRIMGPARNLFEHRLIHEYPTLCAGQDATAIRIYSRRLMDEILSALEKLGAEFDKL
jgi:hypothetical protein